MKLHYLQDIFCNRIRDCFQVTLIFRSYRSTHMVNRCVVFRVVLLLLAANLLGFRSTSVQAGPPWEEVYEFTASDREIGDQFGSSVAANGDFAIISNRIDDDNGFQSGSAYLFNMQTGEELVKYLASDGFGGDFFGSSVDMSNQYVLVGAPNDDEIDKTSTGSAYIFDLASGEQLFKLVAFDAERLDFFGQSVAISDDYALVSSRDDDFGTDSGSVYMFDVKTGELIRKLNATDETAGSNFGYSIAIEGTLAVIGSSSDDELGDGAGAAYIFDLTTGQQVRKLLAADGITGDFFGSSIAISGDRVVIGSRSGQFSGSVYIFDVATGQQLFKIIAADGDISDRFGESVAIEGNIALVGASFDTENGIPSGSAYFFDVSTGQQVSKVLASDAAANANFGVSVAMSGGHALIGSNAHRSRAGLMVGSAYVFEQRTADILLIDPEPLVSLEKGTFSVINAKPDERTWVLYSFDGIQQWYNSQLNVIIDIANPQMVISPRRTDNNGNLQFTVTIPGTLTTHDIWFQAIQQQNVTNTVATQIAP